MRKLPPVKAVTHALSSIWHFRQVAGRIALPWLPVLLLCGIAEFYLATPGSGPDEIPAMSPVDIANLVISLIATSAMAVSWQRFILRDETSRGLGVDAKVLRYALFSFLLMAAALLPSLLILALAVAAPSVAAIGLPVILLIGGGITRLSIRFPAIALDNRSFSFRDAWQASAGNFWPCLAVFLLTWAITLAALVALILVSGGISQMNTLLGDFALTAGVVLMQLFFALFNASVFTSLYGFFVEGRDF